MDGNHGAERYETVIIGGGQAGLATGYHLARLPPRAAVLPRGPGGGGGGGGGGRVARCESVITGGGQAGLATGYHLARLGRSFVILEADRRVGDVWRKRWD